MVHNAPSLPSHGLRGIPQEPRCRPPIKNTPQKFPTPALTYNAGGLSSAAQRLDTQPFHIVIAQETHWDTEGTFKVPGRHCVSSGKQPDDKYAGLQTMVSSKLAPQDQIRDAALLQGRAQRIRVGGVAQTHSCIDVVNLYQHAWRATCSTETNLEARSTVWSAFDKALGRLPNRNTLIVTGDLKKCTAAKREGGWAGNSSQRGAS